MKMTLGVFKLKYLSCKLIKNLLFQRFLKWRWHFCKSKQCWDKAIRSLMGKWENTRKKKIFWESIPTLTSKCSISKLFWPTEMLHPILETTESGNWDRLWIKTQNYKKRFGGQISPQPKKENFHFWAEINKIIAWNQDIGKNTIDKKGPPFGRRVQELQLEKNYFISPQYNLLVNYNEDLSNFQTSGESSSFRSVYQLSLWRWFLDSFNILTTRLSFVEPGL